MVVMVMVTAVMVLLVLMTFDDDDEDGDVDEDSDDGFFVRDELVSDDNDDDGLYDDVRVRKHRRLDLEEAPAEDGIEVVPVDVLVCARNERCERRVREMNGASVVFSFSAMTYGDFPHISRRYSPFP